MAQRKTIAIILVACVGLGVLLIGSCGGLLYLGYKNTDAAVSPQIEAMFAAVENGTFADTYDTQTTQEFRDVTTREEYAAIGDAIAVRLGTLNSKSMRSFKMRQVNASSLIDVTYQAVFENGTGTILANLKKEEGEWKFVSFRVNSPLFQQDLATIQCVECGEPHTANAKFCPDCGAEITSADVQDSPTVSTSAPESENETE